MHPECVSTAAPRAWFAWQGQSGVWEAVGGQEAASGAGWVRLGRIPSYGPIGPEGQNPSADSRFVELERGRGAC